MKSRSYEIDMCNGPLFGKIISFAVPLMLSGVLQLLFNAADRSFSRRYYMHVATKVNGCHYIMLNGEIAPLWYERNPL